MLHVYGHILRLQSEQGKVMWLCITEDEEYYMFKVQKTILNHSHSFLNVSY